MNFKTLNLKNPHDLPLPFFLLARWLLLMALWLLTQGVFLIVNNGLFVQASFLEICRMVVGSLRFATSGTLFILSPFLVLNLLPLHIKHNRYYQMFADFWYYAAAILFFIANGVDIAYYPITHQRMNATIFSYLGGVEGDFWRLLPMFFVHYWYLTILAVLGIFALFFIGKRIKINTLSTVNLAYYIKQLIFFLILTPLIFLGQRGGFQTYPVDVFHAVQHAPNHKDLILNTPFIILKTLDKSVIQDVQYYADETELAQQFDVHRHYPEKIFYGEHLPNIVIVVLEGFSAEYSTFLNGGTVGYTPFLDSLAKQGAVYRGMANSERSIVGIPAVIAGFPNWMEAHYSISMYTHNYLPSLANTLSTMGYNSVFYHGGFNGTMGFDVFSKQVGFDEYIGKTEYNNEADFDGHWGISDEPFLKYAANQMSLRPEPFLSVVFTLTSHHPYMVPKAHEGRFPKGTAVSHETVGYTDYALQCFFEEARTKPWFENTLFIITSDHTTITESEYYSSSLGASEIPMIWYFPKHIKPKREEKIASQIDIMPSILHYVGYNKPFIAFGQSVFDTCATPYSMRFIGGDFQLIQDGYVLKFTNGASVSLKKDDHDFAKSENLMSTHPDILNNMENQVKAMIQQYNSRIIHNKFAN